MGLPIKMSALPPPSHRAAPKVGEHNSEVLARLLKLSKSEIAALSKAKAI
jgi:crotonobetainyl-CoA:carnitine CoA-transferase CaiB-like acyl-CoA transferase